jgi:hypothetical protein
MKLSAVGWVKSSDAPSRVGTAREKATSQKCSLARRQAIVDIVCFVAEDEFVVDQKLALDGANCLTCAELKWRITLR